MTRTLLACSAMAFAFAAHADVTIKSTSTGKGFGISGSTTSTTYIKGLRMRSDAAAGKKNISTIFDVDAQKMYILDVEKQGSEGLGHGRLRVDSFRTPCPRKACRRR